MKTFRDFKPEELLLLKKTYSRSDILTVEEAGIWLSLNPYSVRKYLREGKIVGFRLFNKSSWRVDVKQTKAVIFKKN